MHPVSLSGSDGVDRFFVGLPFFFSFGADVANSNFRGVEKADGLAR